MMSQRHTVLSLALTGLLFASASMEAATVDTFDGGGSTSNSSGAPGITGPGPTGNFFRLTNAADSQAGILAYDRTDAGFSTQVTASFDFALRNGGGCCGGDADGLSFALLPTTLNGITGTPGFIGEEANFVGGVGLGIDTFDNGNPPDPAVGGNNHVSLHYNNALIATFAPGFELNSSTFNRANLTLDLRNRTASLSIVEDVNGTAINHDVFTNQAVPGMIAYENRAYFGGRTGGAFQNHDVDNVNVAYDQSVNYAESFDDGQANGAFLTGSATVSNNSLRLTENVGSIQGSMNIADLNPGQAIESFTATFDVAIGPGTDPPADGVSFVFGPLVDASNFGEEGINPGLVISADTFDNGGGEAPAIDVIVNGVTIGHTLVSPFTGGAFVPVYVRMDGNSVLDLIVNGVTVYNDLPTGYVPGVGDRFGFGARTGGLTEEARIDNILISTAIPEPSSLLLLSIGLIGYAAARRRSQ